MAYVKLNFVVITTIMMAYMHFPTMMAATAYVFGGAYKWTLPPIPNFYKEWTKEKKFFTFDRYYIWFKKKEHTFAEVESKKAYDTCNATTALYVVDDPGGLVITLKEVGVYYFFCTLHCKEGHKVSIEVN
ncbi:hypothetical protein E3N88_40841 [Mikania micrantha]|uniref:Phytocyanin domain-containing protein n=1 Tax=Mikania micrantha TaxID=192012 RepID=A0A5N6LNW5_9ASTR|nr:hypothetical protein E3N88_40841 [Mikania micrantha]